MFKNYGETRRFDLEIARFLAEETLRPFRPQSLTHSILPCRTLLRRKTIALDILNTKFSTVEDLVGVPGCDGPADLEAVLPPPRRRLVQAIP
jgi:hypothetical protein